MWHKTILGELRLVVTKNHNFDQKTNKLHQKTSKKIE